MPNLAMIGLMAIQYGLEIDYMEYATDGAAQAAYVTSDSGLLQSYSTPNISQGDYSLELIAQPGSVGETVTRTLLPAGTRDTGDLFLEFEDDSVADTNGTFTPVNNSSVKNNTYYSPYNSSAESRYFTGGTYVEVPDSDTWDLTSSDGTIDFWIYVSSFGTGQIIGQSNAAGDYHWSVYVNAAENLAIGLMQTNEIATVITSGEWHHVAITRKNSTSTTSIYIDGELQISATAGVWDAASTPLRIGAGSASWLGGADFYIDNLRFTKGSILWTSDFDLNNRTLHYETGDDNYIDLTGMNTIKFDAKSDTVGSNLSAFLTDSGGTKSSYTIPITTADTVESKSWDISAIPDADKNAISQNGFEVVAASSEVTTKINNMRAL